MGEKGDKLFAATFRIIFTRARTGYGFNFKYLGHGKSTRENVHYKICIDLIHLWETWKSDWEQHTSADFRVCFASDIDRHKNSQPSITFSFSLYLSFLVISTDPNFFPDRNKQANFLDSDSESEVGFGNIRGKSWVGRQHLERALMRSGVSRRGLLK